MKRSAILLTLAALFSMASAQSDASTIESWQMNDPVGTGLPDLANDAGSAAWAGAAAQVATNGSGALAYSVGADGSDNVFRNATLTNPDQTSGVFELAFNYVSADLSGGDDAGANVGYGFRDTATNSDLFIVRLHEQSGTLRLQTRIGGANTNLENFGVASLSSLAVRAVADLDADLLDVYWKLGVSAEQSALDIPIPDGEFDIVRMVANTNSADWGANDIVTVDFVTVSQIPEPAGFVLLGLGCATLAIARGRRGF